MRRWRRRWFKAALVHTLADAVQQVMAERTTGVQGQEVHCSLASQRDADPLRLPLSLCLLLALGIPISKLCFMGNFGFSLGGHVKHHLLVAAPWACRKLEAAGTVLHQFDRTVKHGLAELLQCQGSLWGGCHVKMFLLVVGRVSGQRCGKFTGLMSGSLHRLVRVGFEAKGHRCVVVATTQTWGTAIEKAVHQVAGKTSLVSPFADVDAVGSEIRFDLFGGHGWLLFWGVVDPP